MKTLVECPDKLALTGPDWPLLTGQHASLSVSSRGVILINGVLQTLDEWGIKTLMTEKNLQLKNLSFCGMSDWVKD